MDTLFIYLPNKFMTDKLFEYKSKRDRVKTSEPFTAKDIDSKKLFFVVQKHQATALHYDFRLEVGGVMLSWAVPKGPTMDPKIRRLAMQTEDHPLDYRKFEGIIPTGEYGGGTVMIWDEGIYIPEKEIEKGVRKQIENKKDGEKVMRQSIKKGEIKFFIKGKKLRGSFALVKTKGFGGPHSAKASRGLAKNAWLLVKHRDKYIKAEYDAANFDFSAKSKRSLEEIASG